AVGFYVAKYVNKKSDMDLAAKGLGAKEWNNSLKTKLSLLPKKLFRIRMSRNFGMKMLTIDRKSGSAGMPRPISYAVFCLKKKKVHGRRAGRQVEDVAPPREDENLVLEEGHLALVQ